MAMNTLGKRHGNPRDFEQSSSSDLIDDSESIDMGRSNTGQLPKQTKSTLRVRSENRASGRFADDTAHAEKAMRREQGIITVDRLLFFRGASTRMPIAPVPAAITSLSIPPTTPSPSSSSSSTPANIPTQQPSSGGVPSAAVLRTLDPAARLN